MQLAGGSDKCGAVGANPTCSCECGGNNDECPNGTIFKWIPCGFRDLEYRRYCIWNKWPDEQINKNKCAMGDPSVETLEGKLKLRNCKIMYETDVCDQRYRPEKSEVWAPWSDDVANTDAVKDFCSQHDSIENVPFFNSNPKCEAWCDKNKDACKDAKYRYCRKYPFHRTCAEYCNGDKTCFDSLAEFCKGDNLELEVCKNYCTVNGPDGEPTPCDARLKEYCAQKLAQPGMTLDKLMVTHQDLCGCFLPDAYYNNFFNKIQEKFKLPTAPQLRECYYGPCAHPTSLRPVIIRKFGAQCPNQTNCIQITNVNNDGTFTGDINITNNIECDGITDVGTKCSVLKEYRNKKTGTCKPCKEPEKMTKVKNTSRLTKFIDTCICVDPLLVYDQDSDTCKPCAGDQVPNNDGTACTDKPEKACKAPLTYSTKKGDCDTCDAGQIRGPSGIDCVDIISTCKDRQYYDGTSCIDCSEGSEPSADRKRCIVNCSAPKVIIENKCVDCPAGRVYSTEYKKCAKVCKGNEYYDAGSDSCISCEFEEIYNSEAKRCEPCKSGAKYVDGACVEDKNPWLIIFIILLVIVCLVCSSLLWWFKKK
ncbi:MAG: hypothetical protein Harvfovirus8_30 [Harvfovirus sp.]|uniref:Uncharacterized protein n=1 Tax=Harvfovirus sp. TaxID=2487768 RepID=A0A3G5A5V8_9VIRU|nr:MAG: hypothetical protein Harvfovirus8_30 [Harvfovirus sp.]